MTGRALALAVGAVLGIGAALGLSIPDQWWVHDPCRVVFEDYDHRDHPLPVGADYGPNGFWSLPNGVVFGWSAEEDSTIWNKEGCHV